MVEFTDILPVYLDSVGPAATGTGTSKSWVHTINGSCIVVSMSYYGSVTAPVVTATVGGVSMTQLAVVPYVTSGSNYGRLVTFILMNPPQGAQTIVVNAPGQLYGGNNSVSYQNVSSYGTVVTNSGTAASAAITVPSAPNQMVAHAIAAWTTGLTNYNQTIRYSVNYAANVSLSFGMGDAPGAASVPFSLNAGGFWANTGISLIGT
jgi:hypothetical protein